MSIDRLYWILDENGDPVPCPDVLSWAKWYESGRPGRVVAQTRLSDGTTMVSTVFLGIDHRMSFIDGRGAPLLFETMAFYAWDAREIAKGHYVPDMEPDDLQWRYSTRAEALAGHQKVVALLEGRLADIAVRVGEIATETKKKSPTE